MITAACAPSELLTNAYVEQRARDVVLGLRECSKISISSVRVYDYGSTADNALVWTATATEKGARVSQIALFQKQSGFTVRMYSVPKPGRVYDVVVNANASLRAGIAFQLGSMAVGEVVYGAEKPIARNKYDRLPDSEFAC
jgi:hypothetical protein